MEKLTSIDYAKLIQATAWYYCKVLLNKTQVQKILFYIYGVFLAKSGGVPMFEDDKPQAWPFGPVFPRVNSRIDISEPITGFPKEKNDMYRANMELLNFIANATKQMCHISASDLTKWSHKPDSPWSITLYDGMDDADQRDWATPIADEVTETYFKQPENRIYGSM